LLSRFHVISIRDPLSILEHNIFVDFTINAHTISKYFEITTDKRRKFTTNRRENTYAMESNKWLGAKVSQINRSCYQRGKDYANQTCFFLFLRKIHSIAPLITNEVIRTEKNAFRNCVPRFRVILTKHVMGF
jgi:hypothetical protein